MERIQPYFKLTSKTKVLEVWDMSAINRNMRVYPSTFNLTDEEYEVAKKLMTRDFKTAILNRRSDNKGIAMLADDIIVQRG